jgi:hypothetical protein
MRIDPRIAAGAGAAVLFAAAASDAAVILEAGGWRAEVDDALVNAVSLTNLGYDPQLGTLTLSKTATFTSVSGLTGLPDSVVITWTQTTDDANTANRIIIDGEAVTNGTGIAWGGFRMTAQDSGDATFNPTLSGAFSITPFTNRTYSPDNTVVTFDGGTVAAGAAWNPGATGDLVLDVDLSRANPMTFSFKELPLIPAPGAGFAAAAGALLLPRRRR